ncbi:glycosyl transferase family 2 [Novosphingobium sp. PhB165]|uniref:glycosyltransferase family 2 protein n=1 Tax=Novosphingobium sp. PhB165 TaxID=2485105 RepID=UPI001046783B|nr:glycosyltransferase family A protein [Novosphingobium sp. PhB165]TCM17663.1 glycosyl transferase family 2 [Novosphingobium sp. PhB165]
MNPDVKNADYPLISVVIPTSGRSSLFRAVESALAQEDVDVEVLAVVNNTEILPSFDDPRVRVIDGRMAPGQGPARQMGVENASGSVIALLDDDDFWEPRKCIEQIRDVERFTPINSDGWIAATGVTIHYPDGRQALRPRIHGVPVSTMNPEEYLFMRKSLRRADNFIQSSSLMFPKRLATVVPFNTLPEVCTDWGWVIATNRTTACQVIIGAGHRTHYDISLPGISKTNRTRQILAWADNVLSDSPRRIMGDFCATTPLQVTAHFGDVKGALAVLRHAYGKGRPGLPATLMAGRTLLLCLMTYVTARK